jgi:hypothetical protein
LILKWRWIFLIFSLFLFVFSLRNAFCSGELSELCASGYGAGVKKIIDTKQKDQIQNPNEWSPLMDAISRNLELEVIQNILDQVADVNALNQKGQSSLMLAVRDNLNSEIIESLIKAGANINAQDQDGRTPLMYAAEYNKNLTIILILLEAGADKFIKDRVGRRAYDYLQKSPMIIQANENYPVACQLLEIHSEDKELNFRTKINTKKS